MPAYPDTVFTNVESVAPDTPGTVLLGVSIAVQPATIPTGNAPCVARPWTWTGVAWTVLGRAAAGSAWQLIPDASVKPRSIPPDPDDPKWGQVIDALKTSISATAITLAAGPAGPDLTSSRTITITNNSFQPDQEDVAVGQKWVSLLLNLSAAPYPIPDKLKLTYFLELTGSTQYTEFVALPTFTADKGYDPSTQLPSSTPPPDAWEIASVSGLSMHSEFSHPQMGSQNPLLPDDTLWLPAAQPADNSPLVSNWQAHLYELLGPYLDTAHVLLSTAFDPGFTTSLKGAVGKDPANWKLFRACVLQAIYTLVAPTAAAGWPTPAAPAAWSQTLRQTLTSVLSPLPAALLDPPVDPNSFDDELADLRRIVAAASTGNSLGALLKQVNNPVPPSYLSADQAPALLALLQTRLATAYAPLIATAANTTPAPTVPPKPPSAKDRLNAVLDSLLKTVIRVNLQTELNLTFPAASPLPGALLAVCYPPFKASPPPPPNPTVALHDALFTLALGTTQPGAAPALTANAPPLVLPAVTARAADNTANAVDPLRGIRGVGVLLRRKGTNPTSWTCPGVVAPKIVHPTNAPVLETGLPLLVATRLVYDRDLMTGSMLYNNGPLPCENLLHDYLDSGDRLRHLHPSDPNAPSGTVDPSSITASMLQYVSYEGGGRLTPGTAGLRAGASYEFVTFAISNSGALPADLRDQYPARFKPLADALPTGVQSSSVRYFRTVPVAGLDTCDANGNRLQSTSSTLFPVVPPNVWPRATDTITPVGGVGIVGAPKTEGPAPHLPLLLLTPPKSADQTAAQRTMSKLTFSVRLPSVDPQTWLTTAGYAKPSADVVLDRAYQLLKQQRHAPITDPLITSVDFTLYRWQSGAWSPASAPVSYTVDELRNHAPAAMPNVETLPIVITADTGAGVGFSVLTADNKTTLPKNAKTVAPPGTPAGDFKMMEGEVYLLEARLSLNLDGPGGVSMMPGYAPGHAPIPPGAGPGTPPPTIAGYQLLIEVGSAAMPADLITPLSLNLLPLGGLPDQQVQFRLTANGPAWQNVHRVDFLRQMWRWTGRTQPVVPSTDQPGDLLVPQFFPAPQRSQLNDPVPAAWELIEFAERAPADHIESHSTFNPVTLSYEFTLDLSLDPRATYLRAAPRIFSRYQGLFVDTSWSIVSSIGVPETAAWARAFVRSRARTLKMPRLKALLPLTESAFTPGTPGILAVFDGPAYDQAGLAERLNVDFATVADPDLSGKIWTQGGPDALATKIPPMTDPAQQRIPKLVAIGPIGHTADSLSGLDHKFLSHSYIIRPNPSDANAKQDFSWWFASLRFQFTTDVPSTVFAQSIDSETAFGSWIQFLPGFQTSDTHQADLFDGWTFSVNTSTAHPPLADGTPGGGQTFTLVDEKGNVQTPGMETSHLSPFLMVNRVVLDIAGVEREDYFGVAVHNGKGYVLLPGSDWNSVTKAQVRVIETRKGVATIFGHHADFWQSVAGPATAKFTGDLYRTVSVNLSSPIKAVPVK
jgi:hypothetical protein